MSSSIDLELWEGDESLHEWTITDSEGTLDITGLTVTLRWEPTTGGAPSTGSMTIVEGGPSPTPRVSYRFLTGELDTPGTYYYEIRIVDGSSNQLTVPSPPTKKIFRVNARGVT